MAARTTKTAVKIKVVHENRNIIKNANPTNGTPAYQ
jgi:hypothetical protein